MTIPEQKRIPRNATTVYYATESLTRANGQRYAGREFKSTNQRRAVRWLDAIGAKGHIAVWSAQTNQRDAILDRAADGAWTMLDRFKGEWVPFDPAAHRNAA